MKNAIILHIKKHKKSTILICFLIFVFICAFTSCFIASNKSNYQDFAINTSDNNTTNSNISFDTQEDKQKIIQEKKQKSRQEEKISKQEERRLKSEQAEKVTQL